MDDPPRIEQPELPAEASDSPEAADLQSVMQDPSVCSVQLNEKEIILVGTAHVSRSSAVLVEKAIREIKPDSVAVEICSGRYEALRDPERWKNTNLIAVIRAGKAHLLLAQVLMASFQRRIAKQFGVRPGEEMLRAMDVADEMGIPTVLADRDVTTTLRRTWAGLKLASIVKIVASGALGAMDSEQITEEEIERLKTADALEEAIRELSGTLPEVRITLIDERDRYLAQKISDSPGPRVLAVIGAGHMAGVKGYLGQPQDLTELEKVPPNKNKAKRFKLVLLFLLLGVLWLAFQHGMVGALLNSWVIPCAVGAGVAALLALAHPLTLVASICAAPVVAVHPFVSMGWVAGLVEAWVRKPRVAEFESLLDDVGTFSGFWRNRVSRILLLVLASNILVTLGSLAGALMLIRLGLSLA